MFRSAKTASPRPVSADLPPHLQPMAITQAAPKTDRRVAALGAIAIYGCMPLGLMAMDHFMPPVLVKPPITDRPGNIIEFGPPISGPVGTPLPPPPSAPKQVTQADLPQDPVPTKSSDTIDDDLIPKALPTSVNNYGGNSTTPSGYDGPYDPNSKSTVIPTNVDHAKVGQPIGPVLLDSSGLQILRQVDPQYPSMARAAHIQGNVVLRMLVDEQGVPIKVDVVEGPAILQGEAVRAATQWRFVAARVGDQTMKATFLLTLKFKLT
jgi:protein TonB